MRTALLQATARNTQSAKAPTRDLVNWLFVGRLSPHKGQEAVIRAFAHYHRHIEPRSRLTLAGSARSAPGYQHYLRAWAVALGVEDAVVFSQPGDTQLAACYASADVFVCLSQHEGFCVPLIEAMGLRVPVVAVPTAAVPYTGGDAARYADADAAALAAEIDALLTDEGERERQTLRGRERYDERFSTAAIERQFAELVDGWLDG